MSSETFAPPFKGRSLLTWLDYRPEEIRQFLDLSVRVKAENARGEVHRRFEGKSIALIFEKRSTRTRCAFETSFAEEGGHPVFLSAQDIQLGIKESVEDTARVLGRMFSAIEFRGFKQGHAEILARESGVPVINGLTDDFHPTQALADVMTLQEHCGTLSGLHLVYSGDGRNNVARSLLVVCAKLGIHFTVLAPRPLFPDDALLAAVDGAAKESGARIEAVDEVRAVKNADALYTDVWTSMGEEALKKERSALLAPYQVNAALMAALGGGRNDPIFLHCLPAVKGEEVTEEVFESTASKVFDQAENRKHTIKAIMLALIA